MTSDGDTKFMSSCEECTEPIPDPKNEPLTSRLAALIANWACPGWTSDKPLLLNKIVPSFVPELLLLRECDGGPFDLASAFNVVTGPLPLVAELMLLLPEDCLDHTGVVTLS